MANSYTAIPNIVPGNLTVTGKLTVSGGQIALGKYQRMYRIQELGNGQFVETVNVDRIAGAQDDATIASLMRVIYAAGPPFAVATEPAGSPMTDTYLLNQQPGGLQVGTDEVRVGAVTPYVRLLKNVPVSGGYTVNLQKDAATRDDNTKCGYGLYYDPVSQRELKYIVNLAAAQTVTCPQRTLWADYTPHVITGITTAVVVTSHTILAGILSPNTGLFIRLRGKCVLTAAGTAFIIVNLGAQQIFGAGVPASTNGELIVDLFMVNVNAINAQTSRAFYQLGSSVPASEVTNTTVNTAFDQAIQLQVSMAALADSMTWTMVHATLLDDFTPA